MTKKEYQDDGICKIVPLFQLTRMPDLAVGSIKLDDYFITDSNGEGNCWWKVDGDLFDEYNAIRYNLGLGYVEDIQYNLGKSYFTFVGYRQLVKAAGGKRLVSPMFEA